MVSFRELVEAASNLDSYALHQSTSSFVYLYKTSDKLAEALNEYDLSECEDEILFVFTIKEDMGLNVFDAVYAKKGFGPLAYKVAMQIEGSLAPTQDSRITRAAMSLWKEFYDGKGSKDVNKECFGAVDNWQRNNYSLRKKLNISKNEKIHQKFLGNDPYQERQTMLDELADGLLQSQMDMIYN